MPKSFFITGTDTGVGKTIVTAGLAAFCIKTGKKTGVMKPVQTGTANLPPDLQTIRRLVPCVFPIPEKIACPYSFALSASPLLAAKHQNKRIIPRKIIRAFANISSIPEIDILFVEGAGGVYVPLTEKYFMLDLIADMNIPVILVSHSRIGAINHTLLSIEALRRKNAKIAGIVLNKILRHPEIAEDDNIRTIEKLSGIPVLCAVRKFDFLKNSNNSACSVNLNSAKFTNRFTKNLRNCRNLEKIL